MYILPNSKIRLIKNCPLDKSQENTIYFTSLNAQNTYFMTTLNGLLFENNSYQRVNKNTLRIAINAEAIYNYNYLAFQNTSFGDRWFYAFIDKIEYINNVTSEITYTIDVMQTWHFSYELEECFVEREHSVTDAIGDNIVDEKLETGEYIISNYSEPDDLADLSIVLMSTGDFVDNVWHDIGIFKKHTLGGWYPTGLKPIVFPLTDQGIEDCNDWINDLPIFKQNALVSASIMPTFIATAISSGSHEITRVTSLMRADGTAVRNKKCLTYPYNFLYLTNYQGNSATYRYEFFSYDSLFPTTIVFNLLGGYSADPTVYVTPVAYKGKSDENCDEALQLSGFPQVPFNMDAFKAWLAQNASGVGLSALAASNSLLANAVSISGSGAHTMANAGAHLVGGNGAVVNSGGLGTLGTIYIVHTAVSGIAAASAPPQSHGSTNASGQYSAGLQTVGFMNKHITPEYASIIDDYFTMFGYATKKVKVPNRNARPEWNYVKTIGCKITGINSGFGGLPADDADAIENIYNNGVRFWTNPAHIGNYSYNNSPSI